MRASAGSSGTPGAAHAALGTMTSTHRYALPLARDQVWTLISDVSNYRSWWSWLHAFEATALEVGEEWSCEVQPPVPYPVRFVVALEEVQAPSLVRARVRGDVEGRATLTLEESRAPEGDGSGGSAGAGSVVTLESTLAPGNHALRLVALLAYPVARFGHDWVLDSGARQFIACVAGAGSETDAGPTTA